MKDKLRVVVEVTPEKMIPPNVLQTLDVVGSDPDWMTLWTLYHWNQLNQNNDLEVFDQLFTDLESSLDANEVDQEQYTKMYSTLEENIDQLAAAVHDIHRQLHQVLGDMPVYHPNKYVMGVDFHPLNSTATVFEFSLEDKSPCDQFDS